MGVKDPSLPAMDSKDASVAPVMAAQLKEVETPRRLDAGELFRQHGRFVANFLWKMGIERQELEDLLQEVFMVAHRRGGFIGGSAKPTTWLAEIAIRVVSTRRRGWRRRQDHPDSKAIAAMAAQGPTPTDLVEAWESLARVRAALETLDVSHRAVFVLYELQGESCDAIAQGLEVPVGTVYSRLHNARRQFTAAYARLSGTGGDALADDRATRGKA